MKKITFFISALLVSAMSMAAVQTATIKISVIADSLGQGSYGKYKDVEHPFVVDDVNFTAKNICGNQKGTPTNVAGKALLQVKKDAGYFFNSDSLSLVSLSILVSDSAKLVVEAGEKISDMDTVVSKGAAVDEKIEVAAYKYTSSTISLDYKRLEYNLVGKNFVKISAVKGALYIGEAVISYDEIATSVETVAEKANFIKIIENGQVVIIRNGVRYNVAGQMIK